MRRVGLRLICVVRVKSVFEHELLVSDIKKYAVEVTESEELKIWVLGKAGWYAIKPSAEYAAIFATVEEKARLWMFIQAFAAAEAEKKIKNPTFKKFLKEYHDEVPSAQETHITKHMGFVLINMINRRDEVEQKRWRTTLLYKWYTMRYSKEVATIESQVKKIWDKMDKIQLQIQQEEEEEEEEASTPKAKRRKTKATPRVARTPATPDTRAPASVARTRGAGREAGRGVKARKTGGRVGNHESGGGIVEEVEQGYQYRDEPEEKEHGYHCQYWDEPEEKEPASPPKARSPSPEAGPLNPDGPEGYESDSYPFYDRHSSARRLMGLPPRHLKPWPLHPWDQRPATSPHSPPPTNMWDSPKFCPDDPITMVKVPMKDTKTVRNGIWECTYKECKHCILDADTPEGIADIENHYIWHQRKAWKIMEAAGVEPMPRKWKTDAYVYPSLTQSPSGLSRPSVYPFG